MSEQCEWCDGCERLVVAAVSRSDSQSAANLSFTCAEGLHSFIDSWLVDREVYPIDLQRLDVICGERTRTIIDNEPTLCRLSPLHEGRHDDLRGLTWGLAKPNVYDKGQP